MSLKTKMLPANITHEMLDKAYAYILSAAEKFTCFAIRRAVRALSFHFSASYQAREEYMYILGTEGINDDGSGFGLGDYPAHLVVKGQPHWMPYSMAQRLGFLSALRKLPEYTRNPR